MGIRATSVTLSDNARSARAKLAGRASDPEAKTILRKLEHLKGQLGADILHGKVVKKPLPAALAAKYGLDNLYVEDLPAFWRLLYTNTRRGGERHLVVLEIVDRRTYDKWFPGRGR